MSVRRFATALSVAVVGGAVLTPSSAASAQVDPDFELMAIVADGEVTADGDLTTVDDNSWASYRYTVFHDGRRVGAGPGFTRPDPWTVGDRSSLCGTAPDPVRASRVAGRSRSP